MFLSERLFQKARKPYQESNAVEFFLMCHIKPENCEHGTKRADKTALFPMRTTVNSIFVDIVWSKECSFFWLLRTETLFEDSLAQLHTSSLLSCVFK